MYRDGLRAVFTRGALEGLKMHRQGHIREGAMG